MTTSSFPVAKAKLITPEGKTIPLLPQDYQIVVQALTTTRQRSTNDAAVLRQLVQETCGKYGGESLTDLLLQERMAERAHEERKYQPKTAS